MVDRMEVYGDLLFLVNFSMDFLCGYLTATLLHRRLTVWRLSLAAALGGVYGVAALFLSVTGIWGVLLDALVCVALCGVAFTEKGMTGRLFGIVCLLYCGISMAMGGMMTALFEWINRFRFPMAAFTYREDRISTWLFALLALVSGAATLRGGRWLRRSAARRTAKVELWFCGRQVEAVALVDSGNLCRDPLDGRSVIFLSPKPGEQLLGRTAYSEATQLGREEARRFRMIPMETVNGVRMQTAFIPDRVVVTDGGGRHEVRALVALSRGLMGEKDYQAIISPELIT